ncbi:dihydrofolate reductase [Pedococcus sp. 5OH_020]|uniref:dihydrofolate reductase n=1 Tax=Pedococcus sp. 5OH_020 TaxID=2989814 RepID=UPI0022E9D7D0|nr:dihydrofolate reductase [Pedococcus sp. 5OH_020]
MTRVTLLAAIGRNLVIGRDGRMPWHLPADLRHFKATTMGHPMVMGRKTFDSIGRALPGRRTIVVTRQRDWKHSDVEAAHSLAEALALAGPGDELFVVGGGELYREAMPYSQRMVLSHVPASPDGDTFFPSWDPREWREVGRVPEDGFEIVTYERG